MLAVTTSWGSMTMNAAVTQSEVSGLSGSGPVMKPAWKRRARFSSLRQTISLTSASLYPGPDPANALAIVSGPPPIQASSVSNSSERKARESYRLRGESTPGSAGVGVISSDRGMAPVAVGAAVAVRVLGGTGVAVGPAPSGSVIFAVGGDVAAMVLGVGESAAFGAGVGSEQPVSVARTSRMTSIPVRRSFSTRDFLSLAGVHVRL